MRVFNRSAGPLLHFKGAVYFANGVIDRGGRAVAVMLFKFAAGILQQPAGLVQLPVRLPLALFFGKLKRVQGKPDFLAGSLYVFDRRYPVTVIVTVGGLQE